MKHKDFIYASMPGTRISLVHPHRNFFPCGLIGIKKSRTFFHGQYHYVTAGFSMAQSSLANTLRRNPAGIYNQLQQENNWGVNPTANESGIILPGWFIPARSNNYFFPATSNCFFNSSTSSFSSCTAFTSTGINSL
jgi:hypothetical protein